MDNNKSILAAWIFKNKEGLAEFVLYSIAFLLLMRGWPILAFCIFYLIGLWKLNGIKLHILKFTKSTFTLKFYNLVIWYIAYIISVKLISYFLSIDEDNLKFAPTILAVPISIWLVYVLIVICAIIPLVIMQIFTIFSIFMTTKIRRGIVDSNFFNFCKNYYYLIIVLSPIYVIVAMLTPYIAKVSLLADAKYVSDCGPKRYDKMYLIANSHTCYEFTLDRHFFYADPVMIPKPAKE